MSTACSKCSSCSGVTPAIRGSVPARRLRSAYCCGRGVVPPGANRAGASGAQRLQRAARPGPGRAPGSAGGPPARPGGSRTSRLARSGAAAHRGPGGALRPQPGTTAPAAGRRGTRPGRYRPGPGGACGWRRAARRRRAGSCGTARAGISASISRSSSGCALKAATSARRKAADGAVDHWPPSSPGRSGCTPPPARAARGRPGSSRPRGSRRRSPTGCRPGRPRPSSRTAGTRGRPTPLSRSTTCHSTTLPARRQARGRRPGQAEERLVERGHHGADLIGGLVPRPQLPRPPDSQPPRAAPAWPRRAARPPAACRRARSAGRRSGAATTTARRRASVDPGEHVVDAQSRQLRGDPVGALLGGDPRDRSASDSRGGRLSPSPPGRLALDHEDGDRERPRERHDGRAREPGAVGGGPSRARPVRTLLRLRSCGVVRGADGVARPSSEGSSDTRDDDPVAIAEKVAPNVKRGSPRSLPAADGRHRRGGRERSRGGKLPGCVVVVGRRDGVLFERAYGSRSVLPAVTPMTEDTVFDLASLTKPVATASSVMALVDHGELDLDAPLRRYLPELGDAGRATLRQALTHAAGFPPTRSCPTMARASTRPSVGSPPRSSATSRGPTATTPTSGFSCSGDRAPGQRDGAAGVRRVGRSSAARHDGDRVPSGRILRARAAPTENVDRRWLKGEVHDPRARLLGGVAGMPASSAQRRPDPVCPGDARCRTWVSLTSRPRGLRRAERHPSRRPGAWVGRTEPLLVEPRRLAVPRAFGHGGYTGTSLWMNPEKDLFVSSFRTACTPTATARQPARRGHRRRLHRPSAPTSASSHPLRNSRWRVGDRARGPGA